MAKNKTKTFEDRINSIMFVVLAIGILGWLIWSIYSAFYIPEKDNSKTIRFEVTGITNSENSSTLVQIHWECIKYCMSYTSGESEQDKCWKQCELLGKEVCGK